MAATWLGAMAARRAGIADADVARLRAVWPVPAGTEHTGGVRRPRGTLQVRIDPRRDGIGTAVLDLAGAAARLRKTPARSVARLRVARADLRGGQGSSGGHVAAPLPRRRPYLPQLRVVPHQHGTRHANVQAAPVSRDAGQSLQYLGPADVPVRLRQRSAVRQRIRGP